MTLVECACDQEKEELRKKWKVWLEKEDAKAARQGEGKNGVKAARKRAKHYDSDIFCDTEDDTTEEAESEETQDGGSEDESPAQVRYLETPPRTRPQRAAKTASSTVIKAIAKAEQGNSAEEDRLPSPIKPQQLVYPQPVAFHSQVRLRHDFYQALLHRTL